MYIEVCAKRPCQRQSKVQPSQKMEVPKQSKHKERWRLDQCTRPNSDVDSSWGQELHGSWLQLRHRLQKRSRRSSSTKSSTTGDCCLLVAWSWREGPHKNGPESSWTTACRWPWCFVDVGWGGVGWGGVGWGGVGRVLTFMWTCRWRTCYSVAAGRCMYSWVGCGGVG